MRLREQVDEPLHARVAREHHARIFARHDVDGRADDVEVEHGLRKDVEPRAGPRIETHPGKSAVETNRVQSAVGTGDVAVTVAEAAREDRARYEERRARFGKSAESGFIRLPHIRTNCRIFEEQGALHEQRTRRLRKENLARRHAHSNKRAVAHAVHDVVHGLGRGRSDIGARVHTSGRAAMIFRPTPPAIGAAPPVPVLRGGVPRVLAAEPEVTAPVPGTVDPRSGGRRGDVSAHGSVGGRVSTDIDCGDIWSRVDREDVRVGRSVGLDHVHHDRRVRNERRVLGHQVGLEGRVGGDDLDQHGAVGDGHLLLRRVGLQHGGCVGAVDGLRRGGARPEEQSKRENDDLLGHDGLTFFFL